MRINDIPMISSSLRTLTFEGDYPKVIIVFIQNIMCLNKSTSYFHGNCGNLNPLGVVIVNKSSRDQIYFHDFSSLVQFQNSNIKFHLHPISTIKQIRDLMYPHALRTPEIESKVTTFTMKREIKSLSLTLHSTIPSHRAKEITFTHYLGRNM